MTVAKPKIYEVWVEQGKTSPPELAFTLCEFGSRVSKNCEERGDKKAYTIRSNSWDDARKSYFEFVGLR